MTFNPLPKLAAHLNQGHGYTIDLPLALKNSEDLPPLNSSIYVKWVKEGDEPPGWYRARVSEYFQDGSCTIVYDDTEHTTISETIDLCTVEWLPCS